MKNRSIFCIIYIGLLFSCSTQTEKKMYNLDFKKVDVLKGEPDGWSSPENTKYNKGYTTKIDSSPGKGNSYSLCLSNITNYSPSAVGLYYYIIPNIEWGQSLKLKADIKSEGIVGKGYISMEVGGAVDLIPYSGVSSESVTGTSGWKEYSINIPSKGKIEDITVAIVLRGTGRIWVKNLELYADGISIEKIAPVNVLSNNAKIDTEFNHTGSGISFINDSILSLKELINLGMIWGFLKYYHPAIANGNFNWDAELFRLVKKVQIQKSKSSIYALIEEWVDNLDRAKRDSCDRNRLKRNKNIIVKYSPSFGYLFTQNNLPNSLKLKLKQIKENYCEPKKHYYIGFANATQTPLFRNELPFANTAFPDVGVRLLSLFRYWNIINYFYPYRHLIEKDWNKILEEFIPIFINARNKEEYTLACLKLITNVNDSHANIWNNAILDSLKGNFILPFKCSFVEDRLVISGYYKDTPRINDKMSIGDVVESIDGVSTQQLVKKYLSITPGSNNEAKLRDMASQSGFLLRSNKKVAELILNKGKSIKNVSVERVQVTTINQSLEKEKFQNPVRYKFLTNHIGYINAANLKETDLKAIETNFKDAAGLIIDLRGYPAIFMPFTFGSWLKNKKSEFVWYTECTLASPGSIIYGSKSSNGGEGGQTFLKKVIILVNAQTQSQAEYTAMALSARPDAIVLGSTTAGADGNVAPFVLPGNITTTISGLGIYYPDLRETQRKGIKIDVPVHPTIREVREGRDELIVKAIQILENK